MNSSALHKKNHDDTLYGLLLSYKSNNTFIKVLYSDKNAVMAVILTNNPRNWNDIRADRYCDYREMRRLDIKTDKLSLKYLTPKHIVTILGETLGIKVPVEKAHFIDSIENEGYYVLELPLKYKQRALMGIRRILNLSPQKKYEILEKCITADRD